MKHMRNVATGARKLGRCTQSGTPLARVVYFGTERCNQVRLSGEYLASVGW